ncbi:phosphate/phosphite/phosphonate ABC transporter substrate-binding protein [Actinopolymorpha pittospori]|uniref:Phosphonate transport system substrate-binding protein n=1 Tax=Actinopolymorpha pittospori TaxID=648752 RepID=A0A927MZK0_9ACTN|nr:phosphate/phosphite/phosphonate ABC transporter substrate-binding protein [Actinopolymorpha pittospori]MBE1609082.1 phosphonate transport system substrate-binding protein [Actinopolymorpha pittospori]
MARTPIKMIACLAGLVTALALAGCGASAAQTNDASTGNPGSGSGGGSDPDTITIAHIPSEENTDIDQSYAKIAEVIEQETGKKVAFQQATSYAAVIEAQRAGKVQIAAYGPFSYVVAKDSGAGAELLGYSAESSQDPGGYYSVASVPKGSKITDLSGFKGKKVCFVDPTSTSGYLFPSAGLLKEHIDPKKGVTPIFAGGHDASVLAVADGQCDGGFSTESMAKEELIKSGQLKQGDIKVIWKSELIPPSPVAVSTKLSPELRKQLKNIFLTKLNVDALKKSGECDTSKDNCGLPMKWGYLSIEDSAYDGIRAVCDTTKSDSCNA